MTLTPATPPAGIEHLPDENQAWEIGRGVHGDPFSVLGRFATDGGAIVRVYRPGAHSATVIDGADKEIAQKVVDNMRYGLIPKGDKRRSVVFGGSNLHMFKDDFVDGGEVDREAALALACFMTSPEWSTKLSWVISNPGNLRGFATKWNKERLESIKFLDVATSMLPHGVPFPVIPESTEIMNIIVPEMLQNALICKLFYWRQLKRAVSVLCMI